MVWIPAVMTIMVINYFFTPVDGKLSSNKFFKDPGMLKQFSEKLISTLMSYEVISPEQSDNLITEFEELINSTQHKKIITIKHEFACKIAELILDSLEENGNYEYNLDCVIQATASAFDDCIGTFDKNFIELMQNMFYVMYDNNNKEGLVEKEFLNNSINNKKFQINNSLEENVISTDKNEVSEAVIYSADDFHAQDEADENRKSEQSKPFETTNTNVQPEASRTSISFLLSKNSNNNLITAKENSVMSSIHRTEAFNQIQDSMQFEYITSNTPATPTAGYFTAINRVHAPKAAAPSIATQIPGFTTSTVDVNSANYESIQNFIATSLTNSGIFTALSNKMLSSKNIIRAVFKGLTQCGVKDIDARSFAMKYCSSVSENASLQTVANMIALATSRGLQETNSVKPGQERDISEQIYSSICEYLRSLTRPEVLHSNAVTTSSASSNLGKETTTTLITYMPAQSLNLVDSDYHSSGDARVSNVVDYPNYGLVSSDIQSLETGIETEFPKIPVHHTSPISEQRISRINSILSSDGINSASITNAIFESVSHVNSVSSMSQSEILVEALLEVLVALLKIASPSSSNTVDSIIQSFIPLVV